MQPQRRIYHPMSNTRGERWEDKREEIGKVGGVQIREISPYQAEGLRLIH